MRATSALAGDESSRPVQLIELQLGFGGPSEQDALSLADIRRQERHRAIVKTIYQLRRRREVLLGAPIFGEPAWDLLLDLYAAEQEGRRICITSGCIGAAAPATTSLRCIRKLEERGSLSRERDPLDRRRSFIRLTEDAQATMRAFLEEAWLSLSALVLDQATTTTLADRTVQSGPS